MLPPDPLAFACPIFADPAAAALGGFAIGVFACAVVVFVLRVLEGGVPLPIADEPGDGGRTSHRSPQ